LLGERREGKRRKGLGIGMEENGVREKSKDKKASVR